MRMPPSGRKARPQGCSSPSASVSMRKACCSDHSTACAAAGGATQRTARVAPRTMAGTVFQSRVIRVGLPDGCSASTGGRRTLVTWVGASRDQRHGGAPRRVFCNCETPLGTTGALGYQGPASDGIEQTTELLQRGRAQVPAQTIPVDPFELVVFGGTGDLAYRKLLPALFLRDRAGQIIGPSRIIGVSRRPMADDA